MLVLLVGISAWYATRPPEILGLRLSEGGVLECVVANGARLAAQVKPDSTVFNRLIVLRLQVGDKRRSANLSLLPDSLSKEQFRVLRLWLRWHAKENVESGV